MHSAFLIHICWTVIYPVNGIIQCLSIRGPVSLWKLKEYQCLHCEENSPFVTYFLMIFWISVENAFPFPFRSLIGLSQWRIKHNIFCHHTSYCNIIKIKTYRALKKFKCFIHIFNLVYPQLAPSYIVKKKLSLLYMHAYARITPFLLCYIQVSLTFALFLKAVDNLDF